MFLKVWLLGLSILNFIIAFMEFTVLSIFLFGFGVYFAYEFYREVRA